MPPSPTWPCPAARPDRPWIGLNMVTSLDGRAQRDGTADDIGDRADRRLMRLLRVPYDAVAIGIGTLRAVDGWTDLPADLAAVREAAGRPPQPLGVLIAGEGPIPTDGRWFTTDQPRLVVVGQRRPATGRRGRGAGRADTASRAGLAGRRAPGAGDRLRPARGRPHRERPLPRRGAHRRAVLDGGAVAARRGGAAHDRPGSPDPEPRGRRPW